MRLDEKLLNRFGILIQRANQFTSIWSASENFEIETIDKEQAVQWGMNNLFLLKKIFGEESEYYKRFYEHSKLFISENNRYQVLAAFSILKAAKDDYENGYLFDTRTLIEAEIFSDILEQSEELLKKGHYQASAVIAGCVLEDGLRKLCDKNNITFLKKPTIEPMNVELAKIGVYNQFIKDKVSSTGKLRNHAAHVEWSEFAEKDVEDMIRDVRRFMEDYFS